MSVTHSVFLHVTALFVSTSCLQLDCLLEIAMHGLLAWHPFVTISLSYNLSLLQHPDVANVTEISGVLFTYVH